MDPLGLILTLLLPVIIAFIISEIIFRRTLKEEIFIKEQTKEREIPLGPLHRALQDLPKEIQIDLHLVEIKNRFLSLVNELKKEKVKVELYSRWGEKFNGMAASLNTILPLKPKFQSLLSNDTLGITPHFNNSLSQAISEVIVNAEKGDVDRCEEAISGLGNVVERYTKLFEYWFSLCKAASFGIVTQDEIKKIIESKGWLRHGINNIFEEKGTGRKLIWLAWNILSKPDLLSRLTELMAVEMKVYQEAFGEFDTICIMDSTSLQLVTRLPTPERRLFVDIDDDIFLPDGVRCGEKVLLVDSIVQTGDHLNRINKRISDEKGELVGAIFICFNDLLPKDKKRLPIIDRMRNDRKLIYLYNISDFYELWKQREQRSRED